jgi:hypothetical protein
MIPEDVVAAAGPERLLPPRSAVGQSATLADIVRRLLCS